VADSYLASGRLAPVLIVLVIAAIWFGSRWVMRQGRFGYSLPARVKPAAEISPDSANTLRELLRPGERAWEPLPVADWDVHQQEVDGEGQIPSEEPERWLVLTPTRVLAVRQADGEVDVDIPVDAITNLGLAPLPGNYTRKLSGIALQADMPDGHRRWLWGGAAATAPGWVIQAREVIEASLAEHSGPESAVRSSAAHSATWPLVDFAHPERVDLATGHHMRPIRESDVDIDYPAVMGSRDRLWAKYREAWGWPPAELTYEEDRRDLARHEDEMTRGEAFNFAIFDAEETELVGCVYVDPPDSGSPQGTDAVVSWWLVDSLAGSDLDSELSDFVPRWLTQTWGFRAVHYHP